MSEKIITTLGVLTKKEKLSSLESQYCNRFFVLKTEHPYPGYYDQTVPDERALIPKSLFLVLKDEIEDEKIFRIADNVYQQKGITLAPAVVQISNKLKSAIRIKNFKKFDDIRTIVDFLLENNFRFEKYNKTDEYESLIKIKKFFRLKEVAEGEWFDTRDNGTAYFSLPGKLEWDEFETLTYKIKNNIDNNLFDAAIAYFFHDFKVIDVVRIFEPKRQLEKIEKIKNYYLKELS